MLGYLFTNCTALSHLLTFNQKLSNGFALKQQAWEKRKITVVTASCKDRCKWKAAHQLKNQRKNMKILLKKKKINCKKD